jgi:hypothetical protein
VPIRDVSTLGLGELLGSLLSAVVEGQQAATASSLAFVREIGLVQGEAGQPDRFQTVPIRYTKLDESQQPAQFELQVPLLAMVSIPTLKVKEAKIAFQYDVLTTEREEPSDEDETSLPDRLGIAGLRPVSLVGYVARRSVSRETRETTGVDVEVTVESEPLPLGIERLLELTELAVSQQVTEDEQ